jgi:aryl-alcohol dehydrogenase-like predicted oxidoreductase
MQVSAVAFGAWPIAGITSPGTVEAESLATLEACFDLGVNHIDTAFAYGHGGESERLIARAMEGRRDNVVLATKGGLHWSPDKQLLKDARPVALRRECEESLRRLNTDRVELFYLHAPDPAIAIEESAGAIRRLIDEGKVRAAGASNVDVAQLQAFSKECPLSAVQPPYNMLQRDIEAELLPWCRQREISVLVYWPLMKGLLGGKLRGNETFENDSRHNYPMFQGEEYRKNLALVEDLRAIAAESGHTVAQLVIAWTIHQPGVTAALCGAKRPDQLRETAASADWQLSDQDLARIDEALARRGPVATMPI